VLYRTYRETHPDSARFCRHRQCTFVQVRAHWPIVIRCRPDASLAFGASFIWLAFHNCSFWEETLGAMWRASLSGVACLTSLFVLIFLSASGLAVVHANTISHSRVVAASALNSGTRGLCDAPAHGRGRSRGTHQHRSAAVSAARRLYRARSSTWSVCASNRASRSRMTICITGFSTR
jgi:hypothetical protein